MSGDADTVREALGPSWRHDPAERRQSSRSGRQRGCYIYIPAEALVAAGINPGDPAPFYRTAGHQRSANAHTVIVSLYRER
jgi:hypothetical protein